MTNWNEIGKENQLKYEDQINQWDNSMMHYREGRLDFIGLVKITTDDWGVRITLFSEHYPNPITLSGAWSIIYVHSRGMSAAYVNWYLTEIEI